MGAVCSCSKGVTRKASVAPEQQTTQQQAASRQSKPHRAGRRGSVSAEAAALGAGIAKAKNLVPKPEETRARLKQLIKSTLLFNELDEEQEEGVIDALFERKVEAGEVIIREGEQGDNFYLIESGTFRASKDDETKFTYDGKGSFGELALMYNCPRAATVTAQSAGTLWCMDRPTFRALIVSSMVERRQRYEATLQSMGIFKHLTHEQLAAIADCLTVEQYEAGQHILRENEELSTSAKFYIIESGTVECLRTFEGKKLVTKTLVAGDVFGEVALLTKAPRQADCVAKTRVKCLAMSRDAFERLMGPVEESLAHHIAEYNTLNSGLSSAREATGTTAAPAAAAGVAGSAGAGSASSMSRSSTPASQVAAAAAICYSHRASPIPGAASPTKSGASPIRGLRTPSRASASASPAGSAHASRRSSSQQEGGSNSGSGSGGGGNAEGGRLTPSASTDQLGSPTKGESKADSPSKLAAQIQEWERRLSGQSSERFSAGCEIPSPTKHSALSAAAAGAGTSGGASPALLARKSSGSEGAATREVDEAKRIVDLTAQPAEGEGGPVCTLESIAEDPANEGAGGSRRATRQQ